MNSQPRKTIYGRNMARNKFRKYGSTYWEDNRIQRNKVVAIRKASIAKYFSQKCSSHDKSFYSIVSPFMTDKRHRNNNNFVLQENGKIVIDDKLVANIFNDYFCNIASQIGFHDPITTTHDIVSKHRYHPSIKKIRETYSVEANSFNFSCDNEDVITSKLRNIKINKGPARIWLYPWQTYTSGHRNFKSLLYLYAESVYINTQYFRVIWKMLNLALYTRVKTSWIK